MQPWEPSSDFERELLAYSLAADSATCFELLRTTEFALPISPAAADGEEPPRWATAGIEDRTCVMAYTSVESMTTGTAGQAVHCRIATLYDLAAGWPDPEWWLAINPGTPLHLLLDAATLARMAAPVLSVQLAHPPGQNPPLVQKVLPFADIPAMFAGREHRVSGYVHLLADVSHIGSPIVLLDALARSAEEDDLVNDDGSVFLLRWPAIGPQLYRSPYGATTERGCAAVQGWVIEEPPFVGTGFVPNVDQVIREFKVDGVGLPHRSEVVELDMAGTETRQAVWDGDRGTWMLVVPKPAEDPGDGF